MSPVMKPKGERFTIPSKYLLFLFTALCILLMALSFGTGWLEKPLSHVAGVFVTPLQSGISRIGSFLGRRGQELASIRSLMEENQALEARVAALVEENTLLQQEKYELNQLRSLFQLDSQYDEYEKIGARIIGRNPGNWYSSFTLDKGEEDGLALDMNVLAGGGLVGRITALGANWSQVTSIISDGSHVSGMTLASADNLIVSGSLEQMEQGQILYSRLVDSQNVSAPGDKVVTSNISDKYLPNILIGYIHTIEPDANNLTKSGLLTPAVDFEHLDSVLVILGNKEAVE